MSEPAQGREPGDVFPRPFTYLRQRRRAGRRRPAQRLPAARDARGERTRGGHPHRGDVDRAAGRLILLVEVVYASALAFAGPNEKRCGGARVSRNVPPGDSHEPRGQMPADADDSSPRPTGGSPALADARETVSTAPIVAMQASCDIDLRCPAALLHRRSGLGSCIPEPAGLEIGQADRVL